MIQDFEVKSIISTRNDVSIYQVAPFGKFALYKMFDETFRDSTSEHDAIFNNSTKALKEMKSCN